MKNFSFLFLLCRNAQIISHIYFHPLFFNAFMTELDFWKSNIEQFEAIRRKQILYVSMHAKMFEFGHCDTIFKL